MRVFINKSFSQTIKNYYYLSKPGIIYGNLLYATAGFLLASDGEIDLWLLLATLMGTSLVIASACAINNYIDRDIDQYMERTKKRALVNQAIPEKNALAFATICAIFGFSILIFYTNWLTVLIGAIGFSVYISIYTYSKRRTIYSTLIGSVSGATPPVAGYCAVTNNFNGAALLLFLILSFWQMPHFYAIAIYRLKDYKAAGLPVLPAVKGIRATKVQIIGYIVAFSVAVAGLTIFGYTGYTYLAVMLAISLAWLRISYKGLDAKDSRLWARKVFKFSLIVTLVFSFMLSVNAWLP